MADLAPSGPNRPFMVIDDGWSLTNTAGPWLSAATPASPIWPALAAAIKRHGVRPGIWLRPLYTTAGVPQSACLRPGGGDQRATLDPTIPENLDTVRQDTARMDCLGLRA